MKQKDTFQVMTQSALSADDFKVITLLYQPLLGFLAHSLFLTLYQLVNRHNYQSQARPHQFLSDLMNEKLEALKEAREKLEALNLLETYHKDNHYIYQLKSPLTPRGFIKDTILGQFLQSEVGMRMYQEITSHFKVDKVGVEGYEQITKQFDDLYSFTSLKNFKDDGQYLGKRVNGGAVIQKQLNYEAFVEKLPDRVKKPPLLAFKTQDLVQKLVFIYQFSLDEMVEIYLKTVSPNGDIHLGQLQFRAQQFYENKKQDLPVVEAKVEDNEKQLIHYLKTVTPLRVIANYTKNDYQSMYTDTVVELVKRNQVENGVINALLLHVLKRKNGELPHISYLEKVLETWLQKGIHTTELAYQFVLQPTTAEQTKNKTTKMKNKEHYPEWIDDYWKELDKMED